jgi:hypothetical protein
MTARLDEKEGKIADLEQRLQKLEALIDTLTTQREGDGK